MTSLPRSLTEFPATNEDFPFHISINTLPAGFEAHRHEFFEFSLVIEGSGREIINDVVHEMKPGTFTFVMPYQIHEIITDPGHSLRLINCNFGMGILINTSRNLGINNLLFDSEDSLASYIQFEGNVYEKFREVLTDMLLEYQSANIWKNELILAKLVEVLILFDRCRREQLSSEGTLPSWNKREKVMIWDVIQYIHKHYRQKLSLPMLSQHFNMSVSSLSDLFKKQIGQNFVDFLHDIRIRYASSLLVSTDLNISEIALESGFGSYKTFSRVFRERKKVSPAEYRKQYSPH
ncbi:AraC-like DNA-binding protein [Evansella vedderi]|uniref:AraC-like DNA-binding protein n=1 Tax=Evansella vedderi TaxID=38282 RepID=A0ABU0A013_9BACI|nr:AraC family transcriptional regulator [Evansella vedderi]MDQ0256822.1 AraC-like DNA-binding protein [Evansella vedderi]